MAQTRVLLIGVDIHDDPALPDLTGCRHDVVAWLHGIMPLVGQPTAQYRILTSRPVDQAATLVGRRLRQGFAQALIDDGCCRGASRKEILAGLDWLVQGAEKGERALLFYAGHGGIVVDKDGRRHRAICPADVVLSVREERVRPAALGPGRLAGDRPASGRLAEARAAGKRPSAAGAALALSPAALAAASGPGRRIYPVRAAGLIALPELDDQGQLGPGGSALDRAAVPGSVAWGALTAIFDTSFEVSASPWRGPVRSLPVTGQPGPCLAPLALSSRTLCAARPGHHAHEIDQQGAFTAALAPTLATWATGVGDGDQLYRRMSHQSALALAEAGLRARGLVQQPTLTGHRAVALSSVFCPGLGCGCVDEVRGWVPPDEPQIHAGNNGFRAYELRFLANAAGGGAAAWTPLGFVVSAGDGLQQSAVAGGTTAASQTGAASMALRSAPVAPPSAPQTQAQGGAGAQTSYPRMYAGDTEYWRLFDDAVQSFFQAHGEGRLLSLELRLVREGQWANTSLHAPWFHQVFEAGTRKRHCPTRPDWPARALTGPTNAHTVHVQAQVAGSEMVLELKRNPLQPAVLQRIFWHHARNLPLLHPTFFGSLTVGGPGVVFGVTGGLQPPPPDRVEWYTADSVMQKLVVDP